MEKIKERKDFIVNHKSIGLYAYYMGKHKIKNDYLLDLFNTHIDILAGKF